MMFRLVKDCIILVILTSLICMFSAAGDRILKTNKNLISRATVDNLTHAIIGGLSWTVVLMLFKQCLIQNLFQIICCFILSSLIDLDHFFYARSYKLSVAMDLGNNRPFLHCTTVPVLLFLIFFVTSKILHIPSLNTLGWLILTSFLSHHIRDGTRRGLWFYPFGSTQSIPYYTYLSLNMILPYLIYILMLIFHSKPIDKTIISNIV